MTILVIEFEYHKLSNCSHRPAIIMTILVIEFENEYTINHQTAHTPTSYNYDDFSN